MPTTNAKLLTPSARGATKFEFDRNGFSDKKYITIPYFNCCEIVWIVGLSLITLMCLQQMQNCWHPQPGEQRNLDEIGMGAASKSMLHYYSILQTVVKVVIIVVLSVITLMCLELMQNCWHPQLGEQRNLDEIGLVSTRKSLLLLQTPTVAKVVMIVGLSLITLMCL